MMTSANAHALVDRAKAGDPAAWRALDRQFRPWLLRWAAELGGVDAEAVAQDIWEYLARSRFEGFKGGALEAWLRRIVRNRAIDARRHASVQERAQGQLTARPPADPAELALQRIMAETALALAGPTYAPNLSALSQGWRQREVAERTGYTRSGIGAMVHRARQRVAAALQEA
jgi:RNA polymerase sigma factor (sigma-70 family)